MSNNFYMNISILSLTVGICSLFTTFSTFSFSFLSTFATHVNSSLNLKM
nr:MAG TPA: CrcB-like protein, Camphor Resistance (CrcB) [Caudoviricetes sp.]